MNQNIHKNKIKQLNITLNCLVRLQELSMTFSIDKNEVVTDTNLQFF